MRRRFLLALPLLFFAACSDSTAPLPTLDGSWQGLLSISTVTASLSQAGTAITGNASVVFGASSYAMTITGNFNRPTFSVTFDNPTLEPFVFSGELSDDGDRLVGVANGSGFVNTPLTLTRQ